LNKLIAEFFSDTTKLDIEYFLPNKLGGCKVCEGKGVIKYERGFEKDIYISCHKCEGKLFDHNIDEVKSQINGMNIIDVYDTELKELSSFLITLRLILFLKLSIILEYHI
jgi:excinuclease ABC subunit A